VGDELEGKVTKVVTFGAFVEILDGVEGLVHISELAAHHVENPREIIEPGDVVRVKILEIDDERRRLSLSTKRVEGQVLPLATSGAPGPSAPVEGAGDLDDVPELGLSEDVFAEEAPAAAEPEAEAPAEAQPETETETEPAAETPAEPEPEAETAEPEPEPEPAAPAEDGQAPQTNGDTAEAPAEEPTSSS
jgi:small subunit ribosomal protein S1